MINVDEKENLNQLPIPMYLNRFELIRNFFTKWAIVWLLSLGSVFYHEDEQYVSSIYCQNTIIVCKERK